MKKEPNSERRISFALRRPGGLVEDITCKSKTRRGACDNVLFSEVSFLHPWQTIEPTALIPSASRYFFICVHPCASVAKIVFTPRGSETLYTIRKQHWPQMHTDSHRSDPRTSLYPA